MDIVGGTDAIIGEFPYIVSLQMDGFGHFCGGSLIKKNWVLTAAHCVGENISHISIGLHNLKLTGGTEAIAVKRIIPHPGYVEGGIDYDFALIELAADSAYAPVGLNTTELNVPLTGVPMMATVAGWGFTKDTSYTIPDILQKVEVPLVAQDVCNKAYNGNITDRMICAGYVDVGGKDSCQGDSGGPLITKSVDGVSTLIGVVSWGEGCAEAGHPGVYSKVSAASQWIAQTAN
ncbi:MAG: serine protease [Proteobacteria bacterium]|nr:MAG: serine protease [Pseudomonadota bacterium]